MMENMSPDSPYTFSTGETAEKEIKEEEVLRVEQDTSRTIALNTEKQEKFDSISLGQIASVKGGKESYKVIAKNPDTLKVTLEIIDDADKGFSFGTEVPASDVIDAYTPKQ